VAAALRAPVVISWSGGKDSAMALDHVNHATEWEVAGLLTTITTEYNRISIHGVRTNLLHMQCRALRHSLIEVNIPAQCSNAVYEAAFKARLVELRAQGIRDVVFGDLFLEDVRAYRERVLRDVDMTPHFPLWGQSTQELAASFIDAGWRALLVCVDPDRLAQSFCGREFDHPLLRDLPESCDPCGERGEFHTFVYDGPSFSAPVVFRRGETVRRGGSVFIDLIH
jgi:uncharacterized protein (TIGR00290 family)